MKSTSLTRRLLAGAAGLTIAAAGVIAIAAPAHATQNDEPSIQSSELVKSDVTFTDTCEGTWVTLHSGTYLDVYNWAITVGGETTNVELAAGESDSNSEAIPPDAGPIEVTFEGAPAAFGWPRSHTWAEPEDGCEDPEEPEEPELPEEPVDLGEAEALFNCEIVLVTFTNSTEEELTLSIVPSEGDTVEVSVPAGETSEPAEFPVAVGLTIDIQLEGESVLVEGPFEFTEEDLAPCEEDGEGGELPVTGASTGLIALGAVVLLAVGGGLFLVARRRRVTFTA